MNPIDILLVEDNEGDAVLTIETLQEEELCKKVKVVNDAYDALDFLNNKESFTPDLILLDLNLPKMGGKELLKELKAQTNFKSIPVFILSTSSSSEDKDSCIEALADMYIVKPTDVRDISNLTEPIKNLCQSGEFVSN